MIKRPQIKDEHFLMALNYISGRLDDRRREKGDGIIASYPELRGVLETEFQEYREADHARDFMAVFHELTDIAVGCLWGLASMLHIQKEQREVDADPT